MKRALSLSLAGGLGFLLLVAPAVQATAAFSQQTGKDCAYCHVTPGGPLTAEGQAFQDAGNQLPANDTSSDTTTAPGGGGATTTTEPGEEGGPGETGTVGNGGAGGETSSGPILTFPRWVRVLLLWIHLVGVVAWLGAIIFVHVVQSPRIAGQGIPRGYLKLAWPSLTGVGLSGLLLTLGDVTDLGALADGRFGRILLGKIALYLILVGVATVATFVISPRLKRLADTAAGHPAKAHDHHREDGRITISHEGRVYDVSASKLWREGRHARRHQAWQDLTGEMANAPHGPEVLEHFPVLLGGPAATPGPVRAFLIMAYGNLAVVFLVLLLVAAW
ncbi:MAG: CopD family protein [Thermoleophilia bacterium]|nr:CopD family protein [Thermoleophilia bacterium]